MQARRWLPLDHGHANGGEGEEMNNEIIADHVGHLFAVLSR
jgi:hypothetical protein